MAYYLITNPKDHLPAILRTPKNSGIEFWELREWFEKDRRPGEDFLDWMERQATGWDLVDFDLADYPE